MPIPSCIQYSRIVGLTMLASLGIQAAAQSATLKTIYNFTGGEYAGPTNPLVLDASGNLYGTTFSGGAYQLGSLYKLSPPTSDQSAWTQKTLYSFNSSGSGAYFPNGSIVFDSSGNLFGTGSSLGNGFVFELSPPAAGHTVWTEKVLYVFPHPGKNGASGGLITDASGNLYGFGAGNLSQGGDVFKLTRPRPGKTDWSVSILHEFAAPDGYAQGVDGPQGLLMDKAGVLYGTTVNGGTNNKGTVFQLTPPAAGHTVWTEKVLYNFEGFTKGSYPYGPLTADSTGALYGSVMSGPKEPGLIFKLTPPAAGHTVWQESIIYDFSEKNPSAGLKPFGNLVFDKTGALYGETLSGGQFDSGRNSGGVIFKLTPPPAGVARWTESVVANFDSPASGGLITSSEGTIFGTSDHGGSSGVGSAFAIAP